MVIEESRPRREVPAVDSSSSLRSGPRCRWQVAQFAAVALIVIGLGAGTGLEAQTDFYNLDKNRPLRVEDAFATKRWAFELQASPLTLSQDRGSDLLRFSPALELKYGLLPGVDVSVGTHLELDRVSGSTSTGLGTIELSSRANLWVESATLPAVGTRVTGHVPTDSDESGWLEVRLMATRGLFGPVRGHLNGAWLGGDGRTEDWWAGLALDYVLPFHHTLLLAETWVAESRVDGASREVHTSLGFRYQLTPTLAMDAGLGRGWSGPARKDWSLTLGITHEFAVRALMPLRGG
jgi:hypothetical protein